MKEYMKKKRADAQCKTRETKKLSKKRNNTEENTQEITEVNRNVKKAKSAIPAEMEVKNAEKQSAVRTDSHQLQSQTKQNNAIFMINEFHNNIKCGPEYICTCCDQLWYKCSVVKCNSNKYKTCSQDVVNSCVTGVRSVDDIEWICRTCDSNLKQGKLPIYSNDQITKQSETFLM